jgi:hypothetical protein
MPVQLYNRIHYNHCFYPDVLGYLVCRYHPGLIFAGKIVIHTRDSDMPLRNRNSNLFTCRNNKIKILSQLTVYLGRLLPYSQMLD